MKLKLPGKLTRAFGKLWLKTKKASPEICVITGIACGVGALVLVGVETWKGKEKLTQDIVVIQDTKVAPEEETKEMIAERKLARRKGWMTLGKDIVKIYWKPAALGVTSICFVWGGRTLLRKELGIAVAAASSIKEKYDQLCRKLNEELGAEKAQELIYGAKLVDGVDTETGEVKQVAMIDKAAMVSPYAFQFDPGDYDSSLGRFTWQNHTWNNNKIINQSIVADLQNSYNNLLKARGYVYENEVRIDFGVKPVRRGWKTGWVLDSNGDGYIDFGVLPGPHQLAINRKFMDEKDPFNTPIIDLNVDGGIEYIFDDICEYDNRSNIAGDKRKISRRCHLGKPHA